MIGADRRAAGLAHQCHQLRDLGAVDRNGDLRCLQAARLCSWSELAPGALAPGWGSCRRSFLADCHARYGAQYCAWLQVAGQAAAHLQVPPAMDVASPSARAPPGILPAQRIDSQGRAHVDFRAVLALALPLMANSAVQIILNLTDMWFVGHISTAALAAVGAVQWMILAVVFVLGGAGMAVQTLAAHAHGARRYRRAAQAAWTALWLTVCAVPVFIALGAAGRAILAPFGFSPHIADLAQEFWYPRVAGASFGVAAWAMIGFFNGIGRPRVSLLVAVATAIANALFNYLFIFRLGWGVAGSAWASNVAQAVAFTIAFALFLRVPFRESHKSHLAWRPRKRLILEQIRLGLPMGMMPAADVLG